MSKQSKFLLSSRTAAAKALLLMMNRGNLSTALASIQTQIDPRDFTYIQELCYGACRYAERFNEILNLLLEKPLTAKNKALRILFWLGFYELIILNKPDYAVVNEICNSARHMHLKWATHLLNAIFRKFLRQQTSIYQQLQDNPIYLSSHPLWLYTKIKRIYPHKFQDILSANNQHAPLYLRINMRKNSRDDYLRAAADANLMPNPDLPNAVLVTKPVPVEEIFGFNKGLCSVQDISAQFTAPLLRLEPKLKVLDACAAPGGKTTHLLEQQPDLKYVVALDINPRRLQKIADNLTRLQLTAVLEVADARKYAKNNQDVLFDRILLDAPCSGTGVIRRHPDIKVLRQEDDLIALTTTQLELLQSLWQILAPGGLLLYATCSIMPEENEDVCSQFLQATSDADEDKFTLPIGHACDVGWQILPGEHQADGFYYARLKKGSPHAKSL